MSWKLSAIVLSPGDVVDAQQPKARAFYPGQSDHNQADEEGSEVNTDYESASYTFNFCSPYTVFVNTKS